MQKPIALCANANGPPFAARGAGGGVDEERGACDLEAMMSIVIFAASGGLRETARGDLPLQLTAPPSDPHGQERSAPQRNPWLTGLPIASTMLEP
jgi:hypothetical protein